MWQGSANSCPSKGYFIQPTIMTGVHQSDTIVREEIFGPLLPIFAGSGTAEAVARVHAVCDRPLALYVFAEDQGVVERLQLALHGRHAERGRLSHLERSTWDLGRYLGKQLLDG